MQNAVTDQVVPIQTAVTQNKMVILTRRVRILQAPPPWSMFKEQPPEIGDIVEIYPKSASLLVLLDYAEYVDRVEMSPEQKRFLA